MARMSDPLSIFERESKGTGLYREPVFELTMSMKAVRRTPAPAHRCFLSRLLGERRPALAGRAWGSAPPGQVPASQRRGDDDGQNAYGSWREWASTRRAGWPRDGRPGACRYGGRARRRAAGHGGQRGGHRPAAGAGHGAQPARSGAARPGGGLRGGGSGHPGHFRAPGGAAGGGGGWGGAPGAGGGGE